MYKILYITFLIAICFLAGACIGCDESAEVKNARPRQQKQSASDDSLNHILKALAEQTKEMKTFKADITSIFRQPLLESQTVRRGQMYYVGDANSSSLRINFETRQDDDDNPEEDKQQYIFDGVWLTRINYQTNHIEKRQLVPQAKPTDALVLMSENFPIIGFSGAEKLDKNFEIKMVKSKPTDPNFIKLELIPKPKTRFADEYSLFNFWIDKNLTLPARIMAETTEEDIYDIVLSKPVVNKAINPAVFRVKIPVGFTTEIIPMKFIKD